MDGGRSEEQDRDGAAGSGGGQAPPDVDDQFRSLLEGLRTTLPGVQLITAFLLTLPLYDSFADLDRDERVAYYIAFVTALLGTLLLMAPSSHQRLRSHDSSGIARRSTRPLKVAVRLSGIGTLAFSSEERRGGKEGVST